MTNKAITAALAPTREEIVKGITETITVRAESARYFITEADFDLNVAFPINYNSYSVERQKGDRAFALTYAAKKIETGGMHRRNAPIPVELLDPAEVAPKIAEAAERHADDLLASYAAKLTAKVAEHSKKKGLTGEIMSARYVGTRDPWSSSTLEVKLDSGASLTLTTSIIVNVSKLGKLFNQFPTRLKGFTVGGSIEPETSRESEDKPAPKVEKPEPAAKDTRPVNVPLQDFLTMSRLWDAFLASSAGNGHDFGLLEDVVAEAKVRGISEPFVAVLISQLQNAEVITVHDPVTTDSGTWTQFTIRHLQFPNTGG